MNDELLVIRCQLGERDAFADLVRAWHRPLSTFVYRMLGPRDADDVTQEVWLAVVRGLPRLREAHRFRPWLFTIARRAVMNRLRADYAQPELRYGNVPDEPDPAGLLADRAEVVDALAAIPVLEREILILFYLADLSLETCADICAIPVGTVKSRLSRARLLLRAELTQKGYQP